MLIQNLHKLDRVPEKLRESIFLQLFETAEISKFSQREYQDYEDSLKYYRDLKNSLDTAKEEAFEEGVEKGKAEVAKNLLEQGLDMTVIINATGLTKEEIERMK